jgi:hypothetical protein
MDLVVQRFEPSRALWQHILLTEKMIYVLSLDS